MEKVLLKIAYRNLKEHKTKTLIIGILVMLGISILVIGNSFIETASKGIEENYINNYTGNIIITSSEMESPSLTMPMMSGDLEEATPIIPEFPQLKEYVDSLDSISGSAEQIDGIATVQWGDFGEGFSILFGVDPSNYTNIFPGGINLVSGDFLKDGEEGIVISKEVADSLSDSANDQIEPGDTILITAMNGTSGTKIRELTVRGILKPSNSAAELGMVSYVDQENMRILNGITLNALGDIELSGDEKVFLETVDEDDLFGGNDLYAEVTPGENSQSLDEWDSILGDTSERSFYTATNPDGWHFMMLKLEDGANAKRTIRDLNSYFEEQGIEAKAWDWIDGAGMSAQMANTVKVVFNVLIFIVAVVAVIIIMNTLVISVTERIGEIGTMRAIGARKNFVRKMITWETIIISVFFGLIGILLGALVVGIMAGIGFSAGGNMFLTVLLGGEIFRPVLSASAMGQSLLIITAVGILASLYPVSVALNISPVRAMSEN